jgi:hypothetical protein
LNVRLRLLGVSFLLCVALASVIFAAFSTVQAYQQFQQNHQRVMAGDVSTVSSWMTIPYIARVYHVPEECLTTSLHVSEYQLKKHATLRMIADYQQEQVDSLLHNVRNFILSYRQNHSICDTPASNMTQLVYGSRSPSFAGKGDWFA